MFLQHWNKEYHTKLDLTYKTNNINKKFQAWKINFNLDNNVNYNYQILEKIDVLLVKLNYFNQILKINLRKACGRAIKIVTLEFKPKI